MKFIALLFGLIFVCPESIFGQGKSPVSWTFDLKKVNENEYQFTASAVMKDNWVIYSQKTEDGGPIPTSFMLNGEAAELNEESKVIKEFDDIFDIYVMKFKDKAIFTKKIQKNRLDVLQGYVEYMTCDGAKCLPPAEVTFELKF